jgi:PBSX family phage terminase large subunit
VTTLTHVYRPRGNAAKLFKVRKPAVVLSGPAGTGKSMACLTKLHAACTNRNSVRALIVRKTFASIRSSTIPTFKERVAPLDLQLGMVEIYGGTVPRQIKYLNGSTIDLAGMDNPLKIMSTEYDLIYVQEASEFVEDDWNAMLSRLRGVSLSYRQLLADCNPSHDQHFLLLRSQLPVGHPSRIEMLETYHTDNPRYYNDDGTPTEEGQFYVEGVLEGLTGIFYKRLKLGLWVGAEGVVYDHFDRKHHVIDKFDIPSDWPRYWAVDFGTKNPFVVQMWAEDHDGRLYMYKELYRTGELVEDYAKLLKATGEPKPRAVITDHDASERLQFTREMGWGTVPALKDVTRGIQATGSRFKKQVDGKARIYLFKDALIHRPDKALVEQKKPTCTVDEIGKYIWDPNGKDQPLKKDDHGCDAMRYMVAHRDLRPRVGGIWA